MPPQTMSRRERFRQATLEEIRTTARKLLIEEGSAAVTVNAVAREMGMSGPALYRYYPSHEALVEAVTADFYQELVATIEGARDDTVDESLSRRLLAMSRAMRGWAIAHRAEFGWMFASPAPPSGSAPDSPRQRAEHALEQSFLEQFVELWEERRFPVPDIDELAPSLREQLFDYAPKVGRRLPAEAIYVFLSIWIRLYGLLCMEVLNQLVFAFADVEPVFEDCLREVFGQLGLEYEPQ
ncbi:TetR/AcrR family transcriptional regulator [Nocardia ninae]|uniref:TetR family transcriptional regulator n=1 Tax=Nocardia ninae NBRC 108245 TaxID=1210091 RepID=A0A511MDU3_9NOCA|nr:TetR/AcrR family transcriptional regulator [Nocardia ninae]GEM38802.1 TetR family transcriptional regulator [Nocardia ninae NBRC 108245]